MRISDWSSDVCSSDLPPLRQRDVLERGIGENEIDPSPLRFVREPQQGKEGIAELRAELAAPGHGITGKTHRTSREEVGGLKADVACAGDKAKVRRTGKIIIGDRKSTRLNSSH